MMCLITLRYFAPIHASSFQLVESQSCVIPLNRTGSLRHLIDSYLWLIEGAYSIDPYRHLNMAEIVSDLMPSLRNPSPLNSLGLTAPP